MSLDGEAARRAFEPLAAALRPQRRAGRRRRRCSSPTPTSCAPSSSSRPSAAAIRATTRWCRSAAPGPLHAARIAEELGISTIVVPPNAGVISAYGLVASDYTKFDAVTRKMKLDDAAAKEAGRIFGEMRARLAAQFADMKLPGDLVYTHTLDMRFVGQAFEVGVEIPADRLGSLDAAYLAELFADAHHRTFMHGATLDRPVEIVTLAGRRHPADRRGAAARPRDAGGRARRSRPGSSTARPGSTARATRPRR